MRLGSHHSKETKQKIGIAHRGKKQSAEHKKNLHISKQTPESRAKRVGKKRPPEICLKISRSHMGKKKTKEHSDKINKNPEKIRKTAEKHRGMKRSPETKQKMREAALRRIERQGGPWNKGLKGLKCSPHKGSSPSEESAKPTTETP
jgi:hypothetical protein